MTKENLILRTTDFIEALKDKKANLIEEWELHYKLVLMEKAGLEYGRKTGDWDFAIECSKRVDEEIEKIAK